MKILKNRGRKNKLIKKLRDTNEMYWRKYMRESDKSQWLMVVNSNIEQEIKEVNAKNEELLDIKAKYYELLYKMKLEDTNTK